MTGQGLAEAMVIAVASRGGGDTQASVTPPATRRPRRSTSWNAAVPRLRSGLVITTAVTVALERGFSFT